MQLLEQLGRGRNTVVYRASRDGRDYAVKILSGSAAALGAGVFLREAALLASLRHPSLARIHEVGDDGGQPYLVMDLVSGGSLAHLTSNLPDVDRTIKLIRQVAGALEVAHRVGIVHRDVKPENIVLAADGTACLIDFGLAARVGADPSEAAVGTFLYSAPEQTGMLHRPVDGRADLYSLGIVLFECLTGAPPFKSGDVGELIRQHLITPPPDVREARPDTQAGLAAIVARLIAKDPDDPTRTHTP